MNQQTQVTAGANVPHMDTDAIPNLPENWYLVAASGDVRRGTVRPVDVMGIGVVLHRGTAGLTAYAAKCAHMGCHLKHASSDGAGIRCALHRRFIANDGYFTRPDGTKSGDLKQRIYPVQEAFGCVFVWFGDGDPTVLPLPDIADQGPVMSQYAGHYHAQANWFSLIANGCDMEHLASVHGRALREEPVVDAPDPGRFRIAYLTRVVGTSLADRVVKYLSGDHVRASMTVCNGSLILVQSKVWKPSFFLLSMCPDENGGTLVRAAVGAQGGTGVWDRLRLWLTARVFISFLAKDFEVMKGLEWHPPAHPHSFGDRTSQRLFTYFSGLTGVRR